MKLLGYGFLIILGAGIAFISWVGIIRPQLHIRRLEVGPDGHEYVRCSCGLLYATSEASLDASLDRPCSEIRGER